MKIIGARKASQKKTRKNPVDKASMSKRAYVERAPQKNQKRQAIAVDLKRLKARRSKTWSGPAGFYANPARFSVISPGGVIVAHLPSLTLAKQVAQ